MGLRKKPRNNKQTLPWVLRKRIWKTFNDQSHRVILQKTLFYQNIPKKKWWEKDKKNNEKVVKSYKRKFIGKITHRKNIKSEANTENEGNPWSMEKKYRYWQKAENAWGKVCTEIP